jgi:hypothetical protein
MSEDQITDFYERWKQIMLAADTRRYHMVTNPEHASFFKDLLERLLEDPFWVLQRPGPPMELMFVTTCPREELVFWRKDTGAVTLPQMIGRTGLGRYTKAAMPSRDGVQPMTDMDFKGLGRDIRMDQEGDAPTSEIESISEEILRQKAEEDG